MLFHEDTGNLEYSSVTRQTFVITLENPESPRQRRVRIIYTKGQSRAGSFCHKNIYKLDEKQGVGSYQLQKSKAAQGRAAMDGYCGYIQISEKKKRNDYQ